MLRALERYRRRRQGPGYTSSGTIAAAHKAMIGDVDHDIEVVQHMPDVQDVHDEQDGQTVQSVQELDGQ